MKNNGITMVEICVSLFIIALLGGGITMYMVNSRRQSQILDQRLHFQNSTQILFEVLKTDLRSLKKIVVAPGQIEIKKVTDLNHEGEELAESVVYRIVDGTITEFRGEKKRLYQFLDENMVREKQTVSASFRLENSEHNDDFDSATIILDLLVQDESGVPIHGFSASMSMDIRWIDQSDS